MQNIKDLQFQSELQRASLDYIETILRIADKYEADRDETVQRELRALVTSVKGLPLAEYETTPKSKLRSDTPQYIPYDREERLVFLKKAYERVMYVVFNCSANYLMTVPKKGHEEEFKDANKRADMLSEWIKELEG